MSLLRYSSNNLNQLTKRVHETGRVYDTDLEDLKQNQERLWDAARDILGTLAKLKSAMPHPCGNSRKEVS